MNACYINFVIACGFFSNLEQLNKGLLIYCHFLHMTLIDFPCRTDNSGPGCNLWLE